MTQETPITSTDFLFENEELYQRILQRYDRKVQRISAYMRMMLKKSNMNGLLVVGSPGSGKSFTVHEQCKELEENGKAVFTENKGHISPGQFYRILHESREANQIAIFDDSDIIFSYLDLLRAVLENYSPRRVTWKGKLDGAPTEFITHGNIIILTNKTTFISASNKNEAEYNAVFDRLDVVTVDVLPEEKIAKFKEYCLKKNYSLKSFQIVCSYFLDSGVINLVSLRRFISSVENHLAWIEEGLDDYEWVNYLPKELKHPRILM